MTLNPPYSFFFLAAKNFRCHQLYFLYAGYSDYVNLQWSALNKPFYILCLSNVHSQSLQFLRKTTMTIQQQLHKQEQEQQQNIKSFPGSDFLTLWNWQRIYRLRFQQTTSNIGYQNTPHLSKA